jgi:hypothetical protein
MNAHDPHALDRPSLDELEGSLRAAVAEVRSRPAPAEALARTLARARQLGHGSRRDELPALWRVLAGAGLAAGIVLSIALYYWHRGSAARPPAAADLAQEPVRKNAPVVRPGARLGLPGDGMKAPPPRVQRAPKVAVSYFRPARPVAFAPGGMILASTGGAQPIRLGQPVKGVEGTGNVLHVWDVVRGAEVWKPVKWGELGHRTQAEGIWIGTLALSPDGRLLASAADGHVRVWDVATGHQLYGNESNAVALVFSCDGKLLAVQEGAGARAKVRIWHAAAGKQVCQVAGQGASFPSFAFSADGKRLASACEDGALRLWDVATGRELGRGPGGHRETVTTLALSPDGRLLASGSADSAVRLLDVVTGKELRRLPLAEPGGVPGWPVTLTFSPDGRLVAVGGTDRIILWDVATGSVVRRFDRLSGGAVFLAFSPDGKTLASVPEAYGVAVPENGKLGLLGGGEAEVYPTVHFWEVASGQERFALPAEAAPPDGGPQVRRSAGLWGGGKTGLYWGVAMRQRQGQAAGPTPAELRQCWDALAPPDAARAYRAACALAVAPARAVPFLRQQLRPPDRVDPTRLARLVDDLGSDRFRIREAATRELERLRELAEPALRQALQGRLSLESRRRLERILNKVEAAADTGPRPRLARAVEVLEEIADPGARQLLRELAAGAPGAWLTRDARAALARLSDQRRRP